MTAPCTMPGCERDVADDRLRGGLCDRCRATVDGADGQEREPKTEHEHENPIDAADVSDDDRAFMLRDYLDATINVWDDGGPLLIPLDDEGKGPIVTGRCRVIDDDGRITDDALGYAYEPEEAIAAIRNGARGFVIYAGQPAFRTSNAVFADHDDEEAYPTPTVDEKPTLEVLSGSGRGHHETFINAGDVENGRSDAGEIRAENWYVVAPGSIHPTGGVYHVDEKRPIATLERDDVPAELHPSIPRDRRENAASGASGGGSGSGGSAAGLAPGPGLPDDVDLDERLDKALESDAKLRQLWNGRYAAAGYSDDRSKAEYVLAGKLGWWFGQCPRTVERLMDRANTQKWSGRTDRSYRESVLAAVGGDDYYGNGDDRMGGARYDIEVCDPPAYDPQPLDLDRRREEMAGERLDDFLGDDRLHAWFDDPGIGKTTTADIGLANRDERYVFHFDKHRKAREHITSGVTADEYFHMKGTEQPFYDCCMDAEAAVAPNSDETPHCPVHGPPAEWPRMCAVYHRGKDDPIRAMYEALVPEVGPLRAHIILGLDEEEWHNESCAWEAQYDDVEDEDRVASVHPYLTQKTVHGDGDRVNVIDEATGDLGSDRTLGVEQLVRTANVLDNVAGTQPRDSPVRYTAQHLASFARDVVELITRVDDGDGDGAEEDGETGLLASLDPPTVIWDAYETYDAAAGHYVEREEATERWHIAEGLAAAKVEYGESILRQMNDERWNGAPLSIDPLLAAAERAGLPADGVMQAIAVSPILETCPWCHSDVAFDNGARCCSSDDCEWHEEHNNITRQDGEQARAIAWIETTDNEREQPVALGYHELPSPSRLPDPGDILALDATGEPETIAYPLGVDPNDVVVHGAEPIEMPNAWVTQILDGQFHESTIKQSDTARERYQRVIDNAGDLHERPLFVVKKSLIPLFDFPENGEVIHYHGNRGLGYEDCDAAVLIGAPHPNMDDLRRTAELYAMGWDDVEVGGEEHSTRRDAPNPPVYRKLNYVDENGKGRAVPTKHYTGLVGTLFRQHREREIEQAVHRIRPLLADEDNPVSVYLLTNIPTNLPIDEVCSFDELADPLTAMLPVPERAVDLLDAIEGVATGRDVPDGFRADSLLDVDGDEGEDGAGGGTTAVNKRAATRLARLAGITTREGNPPRYETVGRWIDALADVGLLTPGEYEQRRGVRFTADTATLTSALSVLSGNGSLKVAAVRRFRAMVEAADGSLDWLRWARDVFDLHGDRCEWGPPPDPVG